MAKVAHIAPTLKFEIVIMSPYFYLFLIVKGRGYP